MRTKTVEGKPVLVVNIRIGTGTSGDSSYTDKVEFVKIGSRVYVTDGEAKDLLNSRTPKDYANVTAGPKTFARLFENALKGGRLVESKKADNIGSGYASSPVLELFRKGQRIIFTAPCGATGWLTVGETEKLIAGLATL